MVGELELKVRLLPDDSVTVVDLKKQLAARYAHIAVLEKSSAKLDKSSVLMTWSHDTLRMELYLARVVIVRGDASFRTSPIGSSKGIHR